MQAKTMPWIFVSTTIGLRSSMLSSLSSESSLPIQANINHISICEWQPWESERETIPGTYLFPAPGPMSPHVSRHVTSPLMAPPPGRDSDNLSSESSVVVFPAAWPGARGAAKTTWLRSVSTLYRILTLHSSLRAKSRSFHADVETSLVPAASLPRPDWELRAHFVWSLLEPEHRVTRYSKHCHFQWFCCQSE